MISKEELEALISIILSFKQRTVSYRNIIQSNYSDANLFDKVAAEVRSMFKGELLKQFDDYIVNYKPEFLSDKTLPIKDHLLSLVDSIRNSNKFERGLRNVLLAKEIYLLQIIGSDDYFLTSDNPGYMVPQPNVVPDKFRADDVVFFPIGSKQMILLSGFDPVNLIRPLRRLQVKKIFAPQVKYCNEKTIELAGDSIFCENREYLSAFISNSAVAKERSMQS